MIAAWMLYSAAVGALMGAGALAGDRFCRMVRVPVRWVWMAAMGGTLLLSLGGLLRVAGEREGPPVTGGQAVSWQAEALTPVTMGRVSGILRTVRRAGAETAEAAYVAVAKYAGGGRGASALWAVSSAALLLLLSATLLRLRRARQRWPLHRIGDLGVLVSRDTGPALVGLLRPSIVVPAWLLGEPAERQRLVVQHEDEHRRAGDQLLLAAACIAVCMLPWNVALWWMLLRTRLAVELDCDARLLRRGVRAHSYGSLLLDIAARTRALPFGAPALADSPTHLERRLLAMTEKNRTPRRARACLAALSALLLLTAACTTELPTAGAIDDMDVAAAQVQAEQAGLLTQRTAERAPLYMLDGVLVAEEEVRGLRSEEIRSIEVVKAVAALREYGERGADGMVRIRTRSAELDASMVEAPLGVPEREAGTEVVLSPDGRHRAATIREASVTFHAAQVGGRDPLIILDGVIVAESFSLSTLAPETIEAIEVIKGEAARRLYGDARAANGVIRITTKAGGR
jgi:hypothetical protein